MRSDGRVRCIDATQQIEGMAQNVEYGLDALNCPLCGTRGVEDERLIPGACHASRQPAEWTDQAHGFGQPGRLTVQHGKGAFGGEVSGPKAGSPGCDDKAGEAVTEFDQHFGDRFDPVVCDFVIDHMEPCGCEPFHQRGTAQIPTDSVVNTVADRENLRVPSLMRIRRHRRRC